MLSPEKSINSHSPYTNNYTKELVKILFNVKQEIDKIKIRKKNIFKFVKISNDESGRFSLRETTGEYLSPDNKPKLIFRAVPESANQTNTHFVQDPLNTIFPTQNIQTQPPLHSNDGKWLSHLLGETTALEQFSSTDSIFSENVFGDGSVLPTITQPQTVTARANEGLKYLIDPSVWPNKSGACPTVRGNFIWNYQQKSKNRQAEYSIVCSSQYRWVATLIDTYRSSNLTNILENLKFYRVHPEVFLLLSLIQEVPITPLSIGFTSQVAISTKKRYSKLMSKDEGLLLCNQLNKLIADFSFNLTIDVFKKEVIEYERLPKLNKQLVKYYIKDIYHFYPNTSVFELKLFTQVKRMNDYERHSFGNTMEISLQNLDQDGNRALVPSTVIDLRKNFIKKLQNWGSFDLIRGYIWRLDYEVNVGYFYLLDCLVDNALYDQSANKRSVMEHIGRLWLDCLPRVDKPNFLIRSIQDTRQNMMEIDHKQKQKMASQHCQSVIDAITVQFDIGLCLHIDTRTQRKISFGKKTIKYLKGSKRFV